MKCPNCGHNNPANEEFCENCGAELASAAATVGASGAARAAVAVGAPPATGKIICPNCQNVNSAGDEFCENCGAALTNSGIAPVARVALTPPSSPNTSGRRPSNRVSRPITKCPSCGSPIIDGANFCRSCGYNFKAAGLRTSSQLSNTAHSGNGTTTVTDPANIKVGSLLGENGKYRVTKQIGKGGMGMVFLAEDTVLKRQVVIKAMLQSDDPEDAAAAIREREFLAAIKHPKIVSIYDFFTVDTEGFIVMELVNGQTLYQIMEAQSKPFDGASAVNYIRDIMPCFIYLHRLNLVYCDFKPQNVMLETLKDNSQTVKLIDLGTVIKYEPRPHAVYGTQGFYAPEAVENPSPQTDLYTICRSLAWMVTWMDLNNPQYGMPPKDAYPVFRDNPVLYRLLYKGTHPNPAKRFQSAEELEAQLTGVLRMVAGGQPGTTVLSDNFSSGSLVQTSRLGTRGFSTLDKKDPTLPLLQDGDSALRRGDVTKALNVYSQAVGQNPKSTDATLRLAELAIERQQYSEALAKIKQAQQVNPDTWKIEWYTGRLLESQGDLPGAYGQYMALVEDLPGELPPLLSLARVQQKMGKLDEAIATYGLILRAEPSNNDAVFGTSDAYTQQQKYTEAAIALAHVDQNSARYIEAQLQICDIYLHQKRQVDQSDLQAVSEALRQLHQLGVETPAFLLMQAEFYRRLWELADRSATNIKVVLPDQSPDQTNHNHSRRQLGSLAEQSYRAYLRRNPQDPNRETIVREKFKVAPWRLL